MGSFFYRLDESLLAILVSGHPVLSTRTLSASPLLLAYWQFMNVHDGFRVTSEWVFSAIAKRTSDFELDFFTFTSGNAFGSNH